MVIFVAARARHIILSFASERSRRYGSSQSTPKAHVLYVATICSFDSPSPHESRASPPVLLWPGELGPRRRRSSVPSASAAARGLPFVYYIHVFLAPVRVLVRCVCALQCSRPGSREGGTKNPSQFPRVAAEHSPRPSRHPLRPVHATYQKE